MDHLSLGKRTMTLDTTVSLQGKGESNRLAAQNQRGMAMRQEAGRLSEHNTGHLQQGETSLLGDVTPNEAPPLSRGQGLPVSCSYSTRGACEEVHQAWEEAWRQDPSAQEQSEISLNGHAGNAAYRWKKCS